MKVAITFASAIFLLAVFSVQAQDLLEIERNGTEAQTAVSTPAEAGARGISREELLEQGVLLIPESSNDRIMAFDPFDGSLIDADFIPADPDNLSTPIEVLLNAAQDAFVVSDQLEDGVFAYDLDGLPLGLLAPAGGVDEDILNNVRGLEVDPANGNLLVSVATGPNSDAIAEFDPAGNFLGNRIAPDSATMDSPFDVLIDNGTILIPAITSEAVHRYDLAGTFLDDFALVDNFPEQIAVRSGGGYFVANFGGTQEGILEYAADGTLLNTLTPDGLGGFRGVYELGNGNVLITNGGGVHEIDRTGALVETEIDGVSARFISFIQVAPSLPESVPVPTLSTAGLVLLLLGLVAFGYLAIRRIGQNPSN